MLERIFMGQRKNKTTKKQRKALRLIQNDILFNDFFDEDPNQMIIGDNESHTDEVHYTDFVCSHCGIHEDIPTHIVMDFEFRDYDLPNYMPSFYCEKCGHDMYPTYFKGFSGKIYQYKFKG